MQHTKTVWIRQPVMRDYVFKVDNKLDIEMSPGVSSNLIMLGGAKTSPTSVEECASTSCLTNFAEGVFNIFSRIIILNVTIKE